MSEIILTIITDSDKVLIGKLKQERVADMGGIEYVFPGGKVEENEELETAAMREAKEETGLDIEIVKLIHTRIHPVTSKEISYFHCKVLEGELDASSSDNDDIDSLLWVSISELKTYIPTLNEVVETYLG